MNTTFTSIGFIGLGVMGEPICRNLLQKSGLPVAVHDTNPEPVDRLMRDGATRARSLRELIAESDLLFLSLPSGEVVQQVARDKDGLLAVERPGQVVVDLSTTSVDVTRRLFSEFEQRQKVFIDAPVARTRAAAEAGTLAVMVGADDRCFEKVLPLLMTFASDVTRCGGVGCGQVVKILNNMVLFEVVAALCEAKAIGERAGVSPELLFEAFSKGSADSFALRNHGMKAILPGAFPDRAFSVDYAGKDLRYALELAAQEGVQAQGAKYVESLFGAATAAGHRSAYWPVISRLFQSSPQG